MPGRFKLVSLEHRAEEKTVPGNYGLAGAEAARAFHATFPMYAPTPLASLPDTAEVLGLGGIYVKDESKRFGLNAFKVLGGSYAIGSYLAGHLGLAPEEMSYERLVSDEIRERLGKLTFITATDGNHGRGVAWTAAQLGMYSVVHMPKGTAAERLENILALGSRADIRELNYDDCVRLAGIEAVENGWVLVQDTSWDGYEQIPALIMQGYCTMALEAYEQLPEKPTHIFLQAGVGSMAAAVAGFFASVYGKDRPIVTIVEPNKADCLFRTAEANDGVLHTVGGDMDTIMAGLACGEPCGLAWDILCECADHFISCPDYAAALGMRILGNPWGEDGRIISGESGASAFGCVAAVMLEPRLAHIRERLRLDENSKLLFFSTEGATDRGNYRAIVWEGKHPTESLA